jgi:two-component system response regulator AtoC
MRHRPRESLVLAIATDAGIRRELASLLADQGCRSMLASGTDEALAAVKGNRFAFSLLDLHEADGIETLRRLRAHGDDSGPIIVVSNGDDRDRTEAARSLGVAAVIPRPPSSRDLDAAVNGWAVPRRPGPETALDDDSPARLEQELSLYRSAAMREVRDIIAQAAGIDVTVLISGETGVGKDLVARAIHQQSARRGAPFVKMNCAAVPRDLLESELFGHERGAFTGAHEQKIGKFEAANRGTIFLDEIGDLHQTLQGKLLHVLQDGQFSRVGGRSAVKVDVRVLAATNQNLEQTVAAGRFREDLYYRLNVIQIVVPPLRDRREEIPFLAQYFIDRYSRLFGRTPFTLAPDPLRRLVEYRFPGNVRELENIVKRMIVLNDPALSRVAIPNGGAAGTAAAASGPAHGDHAPAPPAGLPGAGRASLREIGRRAAQLAERDAILQALEEAHWNRIRAAKQLRISYRALLYKIKDGALDKKRRAPDQS